MKPALILSMLLLSMCARAQGPQKLVDVPYDSWPGATVKGWLYLPADYDTSSKKYPVVFFFHGLGEAGSNPYLLLNVGLPQLLSNGMRPDNVTNPVTGEKFSFIVLSVQHWSWSPNPNWLPHQLKWLTQNYRVDTNRVYVTGLSAGGQGSFSAAVQNNDISRLITAAVPMSPASVWPYDPTLIHQNEIETWFFSGNTDGGYTINATNYNNDCNNQYPGSSKLSIYNGGHCCWTTFYSTSWRDPSNNLSIWEWMLISSKQTNNLPVLPVNFINFDVKRENSSVKVSWKVSEEFKVDRYEIEKSPSGAGFYTIGTVDAAAKMDYQFTTSLYNAAGQYRIKAIDADGKYKYSPVVNFNEGKSSVAVRAFPIPAKNEITLQHPVAREGSRIDLHGSDGRLIRSVVPGHQMQQTTVDLSTIQTGSYFIRFTSGDMVETVKFSKQ